MAGLSENHIMGLVIIDNIVNAESPSLAFIQQPYGIEICIPL